MKYCVNIVVFFVVCPLYILLFTLHFLLLREQPVVYFIYFELGVFKFD